MSITGTVLYTKGHGRYSTVQAFFRSSVVIGNLLRTKSFGRNNDEAKQAGRNRMAIYEDEGQNKESDTNDVGWINRLRTALDTDGFRLHFQPIYDQLEATQPDMLN